MIHIKELNYDGREKVHSTPRYKGTTTCFTSEDDDQTNPSKIWGGSNSIYYCHNLLDPMSHDIYMDFNTIDNRTYLLTGLFSWKSCSSDHWSCFIVPKVTPTSGGTNTNYNLYNGYLIIPAAGDGTLTVNSNDIQLVQVPLNESGQRSGSGYWDADYNTSTNQFENITANATGEGEFNMFSTEIIMNKYVNKYRLIGSSSSILTSYDADMLGHGMRLKFNFTTVGADKLWYFAGAITMFRVKSV